jgi:hypothetical protein
VQRKEFATPRLIPENPETLAGLAWHLNKGALKGNADDK